MTPVKIFKSLLGLIILLVAANAKAQVFPNFGGQRAGLSTLSFLKNDMDPGVFSLAGAGTAQSGNAFSSANNPAGLAALERPHFAVSHLFLGGGIQQSFGAMSFKLKNGASFTTSVNSLNAGNMMVRTEFQPNGTGEYYFVSNTAFGLSYALKLSEMFSLGATASLVYENMAGFKNAAISTDLGFLYHTDFRNLKFAVCLRNFGGNTSLGREEIPVVYNRQGIQLEQHTLPTVFELGVSMLVWSRNQHKLTGLLELNHPNDNAENIRMGLEYKFGELFAGRLGYMLSVTGQTLPSAGISLKLHKAKKLLFHYGVHPSTDFGSRNILGLSGELKFPSHKTL